jgi:molybdenum cofactor guanylyltransferase
MLEWTGFPRHADEKAFNFSGLPVAVCRGPAGFRSSARRPRRHIQVSLACFSRKQVWRRLGALTMTEAATIGVALAGGLGRRMGGQDKPLSEIDGRTMLERVIERLRTQCEGLILNANGEAARFASLGLPVVADDVEGFAGPLAGVLAALDWTAANAPETEWVVSAASDVPFLPRDLVARLHEARRLERTRLAVGASGGRSHPTIGLWNVDLRGELRRALVVEGCRRVDRFTARYPLAVASWPIEGRDPFFNVNTPSDLQEAGRLARQHSD